MGPASHPRVIEVYRRYYMLCLTLNEEIEAVEDQDDDAELDPDNPDFWGSDDDDDDDDEDDEDDEEEYEIETFEFLMDWLVEDYDELHLFMSHLIFQPIGKENE